MHLMARPKGYAENTVFLGFRLDQESLDSLKRLAMEDGEYNVSALLRKIIHNYLASIKTSHKK